METVTSSEMQTLTVISFFLGYDFTNASDKVTEKFSKYAHEEIPGKFLTVERIIRLYGFQGNVSEIALYGHQYRYEADMKVTLSLKQMQS